MLHLLHCPRGGVGIRRAERSAYVAAKEAVPRSEHVVTSARAKVSSARLKRADAEPGESARAEARPSRSPVEAATAVARGAAPRLGNGGESGPAK